MDDYSYVMLVCQLVILEIIRVHHIYTPNCTESSYSEVFGSPCVGSPEVRREFRHGCGLSSQPGVLADVGSPDADLARVRQTCFDWLDPPFTP